MCFRCTTYFRGIPSYALPITAGIRQNLLRKSVQPATDRVMFRQGPMAPGLHCPRLAGALAPCVLSPSTSFSIWIYGIPSGGKSQGQKGEFSHSSSIKTMQTENFHTAGQSLLFSPVRSASLREWIPRHRGFRPAHRPPRPLCRCQNPD